MPRIAIALALCVLRRINETDVDMRNGIWNYRLHRPLGQVHGCVFGVVGMGDIGRAVARKASGSGFRVMCSSRSLKPGRRTPEGYDALAIDDLLACADVVNTSRPAGQYCVLACMPMGLQQNSQSYSSSPVLRLAGAGPSWRARRSSR